VHPLAVDNTQHDTVQNKEEKAENLTRRIEERTHYSGALSRPSINALSSYYLSPYSQE
jgi:hypothetical protein